MSEREDFFQKTVVLPRLGFLFLVFQRTHSKLLFEGLHKPADRVIANSFRNFISHHVRTGQQLIGSIHPHVRQVLDIILPCVPLEQSA